MSPLQEEIVALKKKKNAVILAHNYQVREIQEVADYVGDSLGLSYQAQASQADEPITVSTRLQENTIEVSVTDRGCGIPPDKIETIFNPFFTTKQDGVGLGLAIVAKIVDGHGGKMTVYSEWGKGSTFRGCLPIES